MAYGTLDDIKSLETQAQTYDLLFRVDNAGGGNSYVVTVPKGANRAEVVVRVTGGIAGNLQLQRHIVTQTAPATDHVQGVIATLAYAAAGSRTVIELAPGTGQIQAVPVGLPGGATMTATIALWRQP